MATHKSALKRIRQNEVRKNRNRSVKSHLRNRIKSVLIAVSGKNYEEAQAALNQVIPVIDKAAAKGVIHESNASRKISRLTRSVNSLKAAEK